MKYPRLKEFEQELKKCQERIKHGTFTVSNQITRAATIDGRQVEIRLEGRENAHPVIIIDNQGWHSRAELRSFYSANKPEFCELLEQIKEAANNVGGAVGAILEALTSEQVPGLVLERLKGNKIETDPGQSTKDLALSKACELAPEENRSELYFSLNASMYGRDLRIDNETFSWGNIKGHRSNERMRGNNASVEDSLIFINRFSEFKEFVSTVQSHLQAITKLAREIAKKTKVKGS